LPVKPIEWAGVIAETRETRMPEPDQAAPEQIEIIAPLEEAWAHMKGMLFPFNFLTWLKLGFVSWLAMLFEGGTNFNVRGNVGKGGPFGPAGPAIDSPEDIPQFLYDQMLEHLPLILVSLVVLSAIYVALMYLKSRGVFMYLGCTYERKAAIIDPWKQAGTHARPYFLWHVLLDVAMIAVGIAVVAIIGLLAWRGVEAGSFGGGTLAACLLGGAGFVLFVIVYAILKWCLKTFVAPIMFLRDCPATRAWREFFTLARRRPGSFVLVLLLHIGLAIALMIALVPVMCCVLAPIMVPLSVALMFSKFAVVPMLGLAIVLGFLLHFGLQPFHLWLRAYPFYFLAQFGPDYAAPPGGLSAAAADLPPPRQPGQNVVACPACGQEHTLPSGQHGTFACVKCGTHFSA